MHGSEFSIIVVPYSLDILVKFLPQGKQITNVYDSTYPGFTIREKLHFCDVGWLGFEWNVAEGMPNEKYRHAETFHTIYKY